MTLPSISTINAFIEDSCVLLAIAYTMARGRLLSWISAEAVSPLNQRIALGLVTGVIGATEAVFAGSRFPYVASTLMASLAALYGGAITGVVSVACITFAYAISHDVTTACWQALFCGWCVLVGASVRKVPLSNKFLAGGLAAGIGQALPYLLSLTGVIAHVSVATLLANAFGLVLIVWVFRDALERQQSEEMRLEAARMRESLADAQLHALQARVHPHFLFNTLTSIAALCGIDPQRAERATISLSKLMRRALESGESRAQSLSAELEYVQDYLDIEQNRLGERLKAVWKVSRNLPTINVPAFSVQTLVENAILHGIVPKTGKGTVAISAGTSEWGILVVVADDGVGFDASHLGKVPIGRQHGIDLCSNQLKLMYGPRARLRLFSRAGEGTIAAFLIPQN